LLAFIAQSVVLLSMRHSSCGDAHPAADVPVRDLEGLVVPLLPRLRRHDRLRRHHGHEHEHHARSLHSISPRESVYDAIE
jgi:hypothetical protein